jgi:hypothetical protein
LNQRSAADADVGLDGAPKVVWYPSKREILLTAAQFHEHHRRVGAHPTGGNSYEYELNFK